MTKQVGIWIRVSTIDQAKGESPDTHKERARMYAQSKEWNIKEVYDLSGFSGKTVLDHPETQRMLKDIAAGHISGLIFTKLARFARNTRELLDFADYFRKYDADLISLNESIDTSTPTGRLFYRFQASLAEWEREEIADRVLDATITRAHMGKPLGGEAPYGYSWVDKQLVLNEEEAPVRKLMFELFLEHKRVRKVARLLNEKGYRTRKGGDFTGTSVDRYLRDPIAKGMRRVNYTKSTGDKKHWVLKPQDEWIFKEAPAIVSEDVWKACNDMLDAMTAPNRKTRRTGVHLFSGLLECACGKKMYLHNKSKKYVCHSCHRKIVAEVLEEVYNGELNKFLFSNDEVKTYLDKQKRQIQEEEKRLELQQGQAANLKGKIDKLFNLYYDGHVAKEDFEGQHKPLKIQYEQIQASVLEVQAKIDILGVGSLSSDQIIQEARELQVEWSTLEQDDKRTIIEAITEKIIVDDEDIEIKLNYIPTKFHESDNKPHNPTGGIYTFIMAPKVPNESTFTKLVELCHTTLPLRVLQPP